MASKKSLRAGRGVAVALSVLALLAVLSLAPSALAAFPGANGKIAFVSDRDGDKEIFVVNSDGSDITQLTHNTVGDEQPAWSPDGRKIAFWSGSGSHGIYTMNADGSSPTFLTAGAEPTWAPDGQRLAFTRAVFYPFLGTAPKLHVMNANGGDVSCLTCANDYWNQHPAWSPRGDQIALVFSPYDTEDERWGVDYYLTALVLEGSGTGLFAYERHRPNWSPDAARIAGGDLSLYLIDPDGSNPLSLGSGSRPAWSPDGTKLVFDNVPPTGAFGDIFVMNPDGTGRINLTNDSPVDRDPDWQPLTPPYPRPNGAARVKFDLIPSFKVCGTPNTSHGEPLALGSCNPAVPTSDYATVPADDSSVANGFVRYVLRCTNGSLVVPSCEEPGDQEDFFVRAHFQDVRQKVDPSQDYAGELQANVAVRITDRYNGYGGGSATVSALSLRVTIPCATTPADASIGSICEVNTTLDTVMPGVVSEDKRAIWEFERMKILDGGSDGNADTTADNTRFAVQGIAVP